MNSSKPQKISRSPARVMSPHIKDGEKDKHREKHHHQNASPRVHKWSFQLSKLFFCCCCCWLLFWVFFSIILNCEAYILRCRIFNILEKLQQSLQSECLNSLATFTTISVLSSFFFLSRQKFDFYTHTYSSAC